MRPEPLCRVLLNVLAGKISQGRGSHSDLSGFVFGVGDTPTIADHAANHPERTHTVGRSTVDKHRPILLIVSQREKFLDLFISNVGSCDGNIEVVHAEFPDERFFGSRIMFGWNSQVENRPESVFLQLGKLLQCRLPRGTEICINAQIIPDIRFLRKHSPAEHEHPQD